MAPLMILNPKARRTRKASKTKKRRRKMTAKQLKFFGPRRAKKAAKKKRKKARAKVIIVSSNPRGKAVAKRKRRSHGRKHRKVFTHNPRTKRRRYRRNPRSIEAGFTKNTLVPAAIGAAGAIGTDMLVGYLPIPPQYKQGAMLAVLKIAASLAVGYAVGAVSNRSAGEEAAAGGVIVTLYGLARGYMGNAVPGGMNRYVPMQRYVPMRGMGYGPPQMLNRGSDRNPAGALGYLNPARVAGPMPSRGMARFMAQ